MKKVIGLMVTVFILAASASAQVSITSNSGKGKWGYNCMFVCMVQEWDGSAFDIETRMHVPETGKPGWLPRESVYGFYIHDMKNRHRYCPGMYNPHWNHNPNPLLLGVTRHEANGTWKPLTLDGHSVAKNASPVRLRLQFIPAPAGADHSTLIFSYAAEGQAWTEAWRYDAPANFSPNLIGLTADSYHGNQATGPMVFDYFRIQGKGPALSDEFDGNVEATQWTKYEEDRAVFHIPGIFMELNTGYPGGSFLSEDTTLPEIMLRNDSDKAAAGNLMVSVFQPLKRGYQDHPEKGAKPTLLHEQIIPFNIAMRGETVLQSSLLSGLKRGAYELVFKAEVDDGRKSGLKTPFFVFYELEEQVKSNARALDRLRAAGTPIAYLDAEHVLTENLLLDLKGGRGLWYFHDEMMYGCTLAKDLGKRLAQCEAGKTVVLPDPIRVKPLNIKVKDGAFFTGDDEVYFMLGSYYIKGFTTKGDGYRTNGVDTVERYARLGYNNNNLNSWPGTSVNTVSNSYVPSIQACLENDISVTYQINQRGWFNKLPGWKHWEERVKLMDHFDNVVGYCIGNEMWLPAAAWKRPYRTIGPTQAWRPDMRIYWQEDWPEKQADEFVAYLEKKFGYDIAVLNRKYNASYLLFENVPLPLFRDHQGWWRGEDQEKTGEVEYVPSQNQIRWMDFLKHKYKTIEAMNQAYHSRFDRWMDGPPPSPISPVMWKDWLEHSGDNGKLYAEIAAYQDSIFWLADEAEEWGEFLKNKYGTPAKMNAAYGTDFSGWNTPPPSPANRMMWIDWSRHAHHSHYMGLYREIAAGLRKTTKRLVHCKTGLNIGSVQSVRSELWDGFFDFHGYGHGWTASGPDSSTPAASLLDLTRGVNGFLPIINNEDHMIWNVLVSGTEQFWDRTISEPPPFKHQFARFPRVPEEFRVNLLANVLHGQYGTQQFVTAPGRRGWGYERVLSFHHILSRTFLDITRLAEEMHTICKAQKTAPVVVLFDRDSDLGTSYWAAGAEYPLSSWQKQVVQITDELQVLGTTLRGMTPAQIANGELDYPQARVLVVPECNRTDPDVMEALAKAEIPVLWCTADNALEKVQSAFASTDPRLIRFDVKQPVRWDAKSPMTQPGIDLKAVRSGDDLLVLTINSTHTPRQCAWTAADGIVPGTCHELLDYAEMDALPNPLILEPFSAKIYRVKLK